MLDVGRDSGLPGHQLDRVDIRPQRRLRVVPPVSKVKQLAATKTHMPYGSTVLPATRQRWHFRLRPSKAGTRNLSSILTLFGLLFLSLGYWHSSSLRLSLLPLLTSTPRGPTPSAVTIFWCYTSLFLLIIITVYRQQHTFRCYPGRCRSVRRCAGIGRCRRWLSGPRVRCGVMRSDTWRTCSGHCRWSLLGSQALLHK